MLNCIFVYFLQKSLQCTHNAIMFRFFYFRISSLVTMATETWKNSGKIIFFVFSQVFYHIHHGKFGKRGKQTIHQYVIWSIVKFEVCRTITFDANSQISEVVEHWKKCQNSSTFQVRQCNICKWNKTRIMWYKFFIVHQLVKNIQSQLISDFFFIFE